MNSEYGYISHALNKEKLVVIVQKISFSGFSIRRKIEFVSDNADLFGMNTSAMKNGLRLPVDYIHPEDRDDFENALHMATKSGSDFIYCCRVVGDDGKIYKVEIDVSFISKGETESVVEFIYRDAERIVAEQTVSIPDEDDDDEDVKKVVNDEARILDILIRNDLAGFFQNVSSAFDIYSSIVDNRGRILTRPIGPEGYLGDFYDLFERTQYKDFFDEIKRQITEKNEPFIMDMSECHPGSSISAAPVYVEGRHDATWLLCAYDEAQSKVLRKIYKRQWDIAENVTTYVDNINANSHKALKLKKLEEDIERRIHQKEIISDAIMELSRGITGVGNLFKAAGKELNLDYIIMFGLMSMDSNVFEYKKGWFKDTRDRDIMGTTWTAGRYEDQGKIIRENGALVIDHNNMTNRIRVGIFRGKVRAVMIFPVIIDGITVAYVSFCENTRERVWTENEIEFAKEVSCVVARIIKFTDVEETSDMANKTLLELFNYLHAGIYVKDDKTGKVLFSNRTLNELIGYDFTGKDSAILIPPTGGVTGYPDSRNQDNVTNWRKYIDSLVKIVDVTEIKIKWLRGEPATVYIVRPVEN